MVSCMFRFFPSLGADHTANHRLWSSICFCRWRLSRVGEHLWQRTLQRDSYPDQSPGRTGWSSVFRCTCTSFAFTFLFCVYECMPSRFCKRYCRVWHHFTVRSFCQRIKDHLSCHGDCVSRLLYGNWCHANTVAWLIGFGFPCHRMLACYLLGVVGL